MKPETAKFFAQARRCIVRANVMLTVNLNDDAGRGAYLACFHAAQAFIFEKTDKSHKTHNGVQPEFLRLTNNDSCADPALRRFLFESYNFKSAADYFAGGDEELSPHRAADAVATAERFVAHVSALI